MDFVVSGASGTIGSALVSHLARKGHEVKRLVRRAVSDAEVEIFWDPARGIADAAALEDQDVIVHLAAESIAEGRWTRAKKARIKESRIQGTALLAAKLAALSRRPKLLICASAIGYYGDCGDSVQDEESPSGTGFLAELVKLWEAATQPAVAAGIAVQCLRMGLVLSPSGGALPRMLLPFRLGLGGRVGNGRQYWSWIHIEDLVRAILFCAESESIRGPVNLVAPSAPTNREFTRVLGRVLRRPTLLPLPALAARLVLGEMATELLLASVRVKPAKLLAEGFDFAHPDLKEALMSLLGRRDPDAE